MHLGSKYSLKPVFLGMLAFFILLHSSCRETNKEEILEYQNLADSLSVETASEVEIVYSDSGALRALIKAPVLKRYGQAEDPYAEMPEGVEAQFYDKFAQPNSRIEANYAIHYEKRKMIKLENDVHVKNTRNQELRSEELYWDQKKKELYTDKFVDIRDDEDIWQGQGFRSNETFTKWRIIKPTGRKKVKDVNEDS
jgi:LPS export ABC transporter protein LptC